LTPLNRLFQNGQLNFHADLKLLAQPKTFAAWLRPLFRQNWVVYLKPPFGAPSMCCNISAATLIAWLFSNHRLVSFADGQVTFRWREFRRRQQTKVAASVRQ